MFVLLLLCVVILAIILGINNFCRDENFDKIPGPQGMPIVGNGLDFMVNPERLFEITRSLSRKYKDLFKVHLGPFRHCVIYNPEDVELLISGTKHNSKGFLYSLISSWLHEGLLLSDGEKWHQRRKILTPAFHFNILRHFHSILVENSNELVKRIGNEVHNNTRTDLVPLMFEFTLHSICETAIGRKLEQEVSGFANKYKTAIHELGTHFLYRGCRVWLYPDFLFNLTPLGRKQKQLLYLLSSFRDEVIKNRSQFADYKEILAQEELNEARDTMLTGKKRLALLDLLLQARENGIVDTEGVREEIDTFMFAGHDTTASALQFIFMILANNQDVQDKILKEYSEVMGSLEHDATMKDLANLKYLECCIKESLRLYPPVPTISRRCHQTLILKNYTVPAGTDVTVLLFDLHRRSDAFPEPLEYRPERFLTDQHKWHQFAYIPFSAGPRNCIGQKFAMLEMKLAVSSVLRRFRILPETRPEDIVFYSDFVLRSREPIYVKFELRPSNKIC